jgi:formiminotetrahydrofolate cyclodeaminase
MKTKSKEKTGEKITRKEALQKAGKYAAFTAAAAIVMLSPKSAQANNSGTADKPTGRGDRY